MAPSRRATPASRVLRRLRFPRFWLALWCTALLATVVVCLLPLPPLPVAAHWADKLEHALGYALLAANAAMLFTPRRGLPMALAVLVVLGMLIEGLQSLLPWRSADAADVLANLLGVAAGALLALTPLASLLQRIERVVPQAAAPR